LRAIERAKIQRQEPKPRARAKAGEPEELRASRVKDKMVSKPIISM